MVRHTGKGTSDDGKLKVEIEVDGEVPLVEPQATVQIQPYEGISYNILFINSIVQEWLEYLD